RRSLLPAALLVLFVSGWTWLPGHPLVWTIVTALAPVHHLLIDVATGLARERSRPSRGLSYRLSSQFGHWFLYLAFLPHQAFVAGDAIVRTMVRLFVTKRHLLEWTTAAQAAAFTGRRLTAAVAWREMAIGPIAALVTAITVAVIRPFSLPYAAPFLVLWAVSPEIAARISRPTPAEVEELDSDDSAWLRAVARRTWFFFESFVDPDRHWLPPDNFQEDPDEVVAERTSPTNIGMLLLSTLAAYDLGYIGLEQLTFRIRNTLRTVEQLDHYRGHLLNWYDIRTLGPLEPRYVSTVDSGNLAAALLAVESGLKELVDRPILPATRWQGLVDTISVLQDYTKPLVEDDPSHITMIDQRSRSMASTALEVQDDPAAWARTASSIEVPCREIEDVLLETVATHRDSVDLEVLHDLRSWLARVHNQILDMQQEISFLAPWLSVLDARRGLDVDADDFAGLEALRVEIARLLPPTLPLGLVGPRCDDALAVIAETRTAWSSEEWSGDAAPVVNGWLDDLDKAVAAGAANARELQDDLAELAAHAERETLGMDFGLLYDTTVRHFFLGYNLTADQMDPHHYDLLASEARLASFVAIAKGDVPVSHWFSLDRPLTRIDGMPTLLSWGGTMFEYLMPPLLLRSRSDTLLAVSQRAAVVEQIADGRRRGIPWGISESGFAAVDADHNYQYRAFGVQGLGRKRGLDDDLVVAPYASALAVPQLPRSATSNLRRLRDLGMLGHYGFYEAVDFTPTRLPGDRDHAIVRSYMAHHQGMALAAFDNALCDDALIRRFEANPRVQAVDLLLQERVPSEFPVEAPRHTRSPIEWPRYEQTVDLYPWRPNPLGVQPAVHVLGNGRLATRVSAGGGGGLSWRRHAVTRPSPDGTLDDAGPWIYVRDRHSGAVWSAGRQPTGGMETPVDVVFHAHMVELHRRHDGIAIRTDIAVSPVDDIEVRRITVVNETDRARSLTFTSYGEVVLAPARDDARHPAFSKLFVETAIAPALDALVFTRRARSPNEQFPVLLHRLVTDSPSVSRSGFETDRERFLGRNRSPKRPSGVEEGLTGTYGDTLDPIMALSAAVELAPFATEQFAFATIVGTSRTVVTDTAARYDSLAAFEWLISDAHGAAAREAGRLGIEADNLPEFQQLLSTVLAPESGLRSETPQVSSNHLGQPGLWGLGISGDDPVLLVETGKEGDGRVVEDVFRAGEMWRRRGVAVDLAVVSHVVSGYQDETWDQTQHFLTDLGAAKWLGRRAGIHLLRADQISAEQRQLLSVTAGATIDGDGPRLGDQLAPHRVETRPLPALLPTWDPVPATADSALARPHQLLFDNGLGGFSPDGREYVIHLEPGRTTPAPWVNILANDGFGTLVTESGGGYTWAANSGEYRLTPWTNDPVLDAHGESLYLRDEETVEVWSPTPGPAGSDTPYQIRHGAGYTEWHNITHGIESRMRVFVPTDDPVKIVELRVRNHHSHTRRLTATYYARWLLGRIFEPSPSPVVVDYHPTTRSLRAWNRWNPDFAGTVAFLTTDREPHGFTADRTEFLGQEGDPSSPAALGRVGLTGRTGA
ncbi:MAG: cellobiose phosphorylase, partial [Acidimicrobiia bacterium]|nr:cellobiose phosphorylase [Acidimicrobiia bacterium]